MKSRQHSGSNDKSHHDLSLRFCIQNIPVVQSAIRTLLQHLVVGFRPMHTCLHFVVQSVGVFLSPTLRI